MTHHLNAGLNQYETHLMKTLSKTIVVRAPAELVWSYIENPLQVASMNDRVTGVRDLEPAARGGYDCTLIYNVNGLPMEVSLHTSEYVAYERLVTRVSGGLDSVQTWTLQASGSVTTVNLDIEFSVDAGLLRGLAESIGLRLGESDIDKMLMRLKDICEALSSQYPPT